MVGHTDAAAFDERIEALTAALESLPDASACRLAKELVGLVLEFHKKGLTELIGALDDNQDARSRLLKSPIVRSLLALHDLDFSSPPPLIQISHRPRDAHTIDAAIALDHHSRCGSCGVAFEEQHLHIVDLPSRRLSCACRACWLLAGSDAGSQTRKPIPTRYRPAPPASLRPSQWDALQIPVDVAFIMTNSLAGRAIAFYPGPAGATESALSLEAWHELLESHPWLRRMAPDVEGLLVRRHRENGICTCFIVPIDACYELTGRIRLSWSGLSGGAAVQNEIDAFFAEVTAKCQSIDSPSAGA